MRLMNEMIRWMNEDRNRIRKIIDSCTDKREMNRLGLRNTEELQLCS